MKRCLCLIFICSMLCFFAGCDRQTQETVFAMDTVMDLQLWGEDAEEGLQQVKTLLRQLDDRWSATDRNSLLGQLNRGIDAQMDPQEAALLQRVSALSQRTGGAFDPQMYSVSLAWGFYNEAYCVPSQEALTAALADSKWDLGGALKGYAGQQAVQCLKTLSVDRAMLNLGGNIQTYGEKADGSPWRIGIQNPNGGDYIATLSVTGTASIVTSGDYQRYFEEGGVRYHHIIDPQTGKPADSGLRAVTVISNDGLTADVLSTALFVMGLEKAQTHWRQSDDFEAVFITDAGQVYATEGAMLSGCEYEVIAREN